MMTVAQMIAELRKLDPSMEVRACTGVTVDGEEFADGLEHHEIVTVGIGPILMDKPTYGIWYRLDDDD